MSSETTSTRIDPTGGQSRQSDYPVHQTLALNEEITFIHAGRNAEATRGLSSILTGTQRRLDRAEKFRHSGGEGKEGQSVTCDS